MMKKLIPFLVLLFCTMVLAQDLPKIAVYVTGGKSADENKVLGAFMLEALIRSGMYAAVERSGDFIAQIDQEHLRQRSGAVDEGQIRQAGMQAGVQFVCVVDLSHAFGSSLISARIIDVVTAMVISTSSMESEQLSLSGLKGLAGDLVEKMLDIKISAVGAAVVDSAALAAVEEQARAALADSEERARAAEAQAAEHERARIAAAEEAERERARAAEHEKARKAADEAAHQERLRAAAAETKAEKAATALAEEKRKALESSRTAAGLRIAHGNILSVDAFLKQNAGRAGRIDFAVGYREYDYDFVYATDEHGNEDIDYKYYQGFEFFTAYVRRTNGDLYSLYAGPGIAVFAYEARYYDEEHDVGDFSVLDELGASIGIGALAGVELYMGKMILALDIRPVFYVPLLNSAVDYISEIRVSAGISIGYRF